MLDEVDDEVEMVCQHEVEHDVIDDEMDEIVVVVDAMQLNMVDDEVAHE